MPVEYEGMFLCTSLSVWTSSPAGFRTFYRHDDDCRECSSDRGLNLRCTVERRRRIISPELYPAIINGAGAAELHLHIWGRKDMHAMLIEMDVIVSARRKPLILLIAVARCGVPQSGISLQKRLVIIATSTEVSDMVPWRTAPVLSLGSQLERHCQWYQTPRRTGRSNCRVVRLRTNRNIFPLKFGRSSGVLL